MQKKQKLLERLDAIGAVLKDSRTALALLGLGSVGLETERLDDSSDAEDPFNNERRYELRYPQTAQYLPAFLQGYEQNVESALAILTFLEQHFEVSPAMSAAIRELCTSR